MKWRRARQSGNVEDRRGLGGGFGGRRGGRGLGIGGVLVLLLLGWLLGVDPLTMLAQLEQAPGPAQHRHAPAANDSQRQFIGAILGETEDVWNAVFQRQGATYPPPRLVLFDGYVQSACGSASAAVGPFYCPGDQQVYIDLSFFAEMERRLGGGGDFAEAYVIAHEVGHHVQHVTGSTRRVEQARRRGESVEGADGLVVRQELQADCYAGVWAHLAQQRHAWLEPGDLEEALNTASAIGDDRLQRQARGTVVPDSFTHGSSAQRVRWFRIGWDSGDPARCDTFRAARL